MLLSKNVQRVVNVFLGVSVLHAFDDTLHLFGTEAR